MCFFSYPEYPAFQYLCDLQNTATKHYSPAGWKSVKDLTIANVLQADRCINWNSWDSQKSWKANTSNKDNEQPVWPLFTRTNCTIGKGKNRTLVIAPPLGLPATTEALRYMARTEQHRTSLPLYLTDRSRYSFTDPERMEGWVSPGPGCKEQLAHDCYTTARSQRREPTTSRSLVEHANH